MNQSEKKHNPQSDPTPYAKVATQLQRIIGSVKPLDMSLAQTWLKNGASEKLIIATVTDVMQKKRASNQFAAIGSLAYFSNAIEQAKAKTDNPMITDERKAQIAVRKFSACIPAHGDYDLDAAYEDYKKIYQNPLPKNEIIALWRASNEQRNTA